MTRPPLDLRQATDYLFRFLAVDGPTGREKRIGLEIAGALAELGVPDGSLRFDDAHERIPLPTESGNLIVEIDGDPALPRRLFMAHRDTVPSCSGAEPVRRGDRITAAGDTALGGDDRAGVAALVNLVATLRRRRLRHPPLTLVFTVREESGLWGARHLAVDRLGSPELAFNLDGPSPDRLMIGAVGAAGWRASITGRAAHAGLRPEDGISAPLVAAHAFTTLERRGWWGRVSRPSGDGTSNAGVLAGRDGGCVGGSTNVVTDFVRVEGEARSHSPSFIGAIVAAHERAFAAAARKVVAASGDRASVEFESEMLYHPYQLHPDSTLVRFALERAASIGLEPEVVTAQGGLDANWMVRHGIPTVTFGVGQRDVHTRDESLSLPDYLDACRLAVALATA